MTAYTIAISVGLFLPFARVAQAGGDVFPPLTLRPSMILIQPISKESISRPTMSNGIPHHVEVRLISDHQSIAAGTELQLGIWLEQDDEWHTYWKSPGSIGKPTLIDWRLELGEGDTQRKNVAVSDHQYPIPTKLDQSGIVSYGYEDSVLLVSAVTLPDSLNGDTLYVADVEWLVCKESCIPGSTSVKLPLEIGAQPIHSCTFIF